MALVSCIRHKFTVDGYDVRHNTIVSIKDYYLKGLCDAKLFYDKVLYKLLDNYDRILLDFEDYDRYSITFLRELKKVILNMTVYEQRRIDILNGDMWINVK